MGVTEIAQLAINGGALLAGAAVWSLYVKNLKQANDTKSAELDLVKTDRDIWKEKVRELEKRSPEVMEQMLNTRIEISEREIVRLGSDRAKNEEELATARAEKAQLEADLERTKGFRLVLELEGLNGEDDELLDGLLGNAQDISVVAIGTVGVDSGMLLLTDPCYIDSQWVHEPWVLADQFKDPKSNLVYVQGQDFDDLDTVLAPDGKSPRQLLQEGAWQAMEGNGPASYSYEGVLAAMESDATAELRFRLGHVGAGLVFSTTFGDGTYTVFGEYRNGTLVRIYLNLT